MHIKKTIKIEDREISVVISDINIPDAFHTVDQKSPIEIALEIMEHFLPKDGEALDNDKSFEKRMAQAIANEKKLNDFKAAGEKAGFSGTLCSLKDWVEKEKAKSDEVQEKCDYIISKADSLDFHALKYVSKEIKVKLDTMRRDKELSEENMKKAHASIKEELSKKAVDYIVESFDELSLEDSKKAWEEMSNILFKKKGANADVKI